MSLADIYRMRDAGDIDGLLKTLADNDEYARRAAVEALRGFPEPPAREVLERLRFEDPVALVRNAAMLAYPGCRGAAPERWTVTRA